MFGGIPAGLLMDFLYQQGYREQLTFINEFPPCIYISRDKLKDISMGYSWNGRSWHASQDHPAFALLREHLGKEGYIEIQRSWINGDRVTKPFYLNNMYFDIGEKFSCAAALGLTYDFALQKNTSLPQYGGLSDKPFRSEEGTKSAEKDTGERVFTTAPLLFEVL